MLVYGYNFRLHFRVRSRRVPSGLSENRSGAVRHLRDPTRPRRGAIAGFRVLNCSSVLAHARRGGCDSRTHETSCPNFGRDRRPRRSVNQNLPSCQSVRQTHASFCIMNYAFSYLSPRSVIATSYCSALGAAPCHATLFSMKETPLPLVLWEMMTVGLSVHAFAAL